MTQSNHINLIYKDLISQLLATGNVAAPRGKKIYELQNVSFLLHDARNSIITIPERKMNYAYAAIEMLGLLQVGEMNVEPYTWYNSQMAQFINPAKGTWDGSYADRIAGYKQLEKMYEILKEDPDSRRAVLSLYNPAHDFHEYNSLDICCTLSLIFNIRDNKLNLTVSMRSNDILLGLPYDMTQFTFLQSVLAAWLGIEMGWYCHFTANLHMYEQDREKCTKILASKTNIETAWQSMGPWEYGILDSSVAATQYFMHDRLYRHGDTAPIIENYLNSKTLLNLWNNVTFPYAKAKLAKAAAKDF